MGIIAFWLVKKREEEVYAKKHLQKKKEALR